MSLTGFKKQINKANQLITEKVGGAKGTELEEEYVETEKRIDVCKNYFNDIHHKITEYLQPNPSYRAKMMTMNAFNKVSGKGNQKALYPQTENQLSELFLKYGKELCPSNFGDCLNETSEAFKDMADIKYSLEDQIKQNFVEPITKIQENDLKEIMHHRKKVQSRRLDFDCKRRSKEKGSKMTDEEVRLAEEKFMESKELAVEAMNNFLESEGEHISALAEFIKAEKEYHSRTSEILDSLYNSVIEKSKNCAPTPIKKSINNRKISCDNSSHNSMTSEENPEPLVTFNMKAKKEPNAPHGVPSCRALYNFKAENEMELEFQEGDIIKLLQQVDESWFEGEMKGQKGFFPINYVEVLIPLEE